MTIDELINYRKQLTICIGMETRHDCLERLIDLLAKVDAEIELKGDKK